MSIKKFKKKPIIIEALQFTGHNAMEIEMFMEQQLVSSAVPRYMELDNDIPNNAYIIKIPTREGIQTAIKLDWVIKGNTAEFGDHFWICKPDYFKEAYEEVL